MSLPGWLNDNQFRQYPFVERTSASDALSWPPESAIVDFGCLIGPDVSYDASEDTVWLESVERPDSGTLVFTFSCSATNQPLVFEVPTTTPEFAAIEAESDPENEDACGSPPAWEGYLQIGLLEALLEVLGVGDTLTGDTAMQIEPSRIQSLSQSFLRSISLGNEDRVRAENPEGCGDTSSELTDLEILTNALCLDGEIRFKEGYNCAIRQNVNDNSLTFSASVGAGAGQACDEVPLADDEEPPDGSDLLTGGPACNERITAINGVMGEVIQLVSTQGAFVSIDEEDPSQLVVDFSLLDLTRCDLEESIVLDEDDL